MDKEAIKESTIKRFDICYDTLLKHLKKFMENQLGTPEIREYAKEIFRIAKKSGVIDTEMQERLLDYWEIRNNAAHNYGEEEAMKALNIVESFIDDVTEIYETMTAEK